jgi:hypothetical protein
LVLGNGCNITRRRRTTIPSHEAPSRHAMHRKQRSPKTNKRQCRSSELCRQLPQKKPSLAKEHKIITRPSFHPFNRKRIKIAKTTCRYASSNEKTFLIISHQNFTKRCTRKLIIISLISKEISIMAL